MSHFPPAFSLPVSCILSVEQTAAESVTPTTQRWGLPCRTSLCRISRFSRRNQRLFAAFSFLRATISAFLCSVLLLLLWRFCRRPARTRGAARGNTPLRRGEWRHTPFCELLRYNFFLGRSPSRVPLCGFVFWCPLGRVGFFC